MRIFLICGPLGSPVREFAVNITKQLEIQDRGFLLLDEDKDCLNDEDIERISETSEVVIVVGSTLFLKELFLAGLPKKDTVKLYVETSHEDCLMKLIRTAKSEEEFEVTRFMKYYLEHIKPLNELIFSSVPSADLVIPQDKIHELEVLKMLTSVSELIDLPRDFLGKETDCKGHDHNFFSSSQRIENLSDNSSVYLPTRRKSI